MSCPQLGEARREPALVGFGDLEAARDARSAPRPVTARLVGTVGTASNCCANGVSPNGRSSAGPLLIFGRVHAPRDCACCQYRFFENRPLDEVVPSPRTPRWGAVRAGHGQSAPPLPRN